VAYLVAEGRDVTERATQERATRRQMERLEDRIAERIVELAGLNQALHPEVASREQIAAELSDLYNYTPCGFHSAGPDGTILKINDTALAWLGYGRGEVVGKLKLADLTAPHDRPALDEAFAALQQTGSLRDMQVDMLRKDGTTFPVLLNSSAAFDTAGRFLMSRASVVDLTQQRQADEALRQSNTDLRAATDALRMSEARLRGIIEGAPDAIIMVDETQRILLSNPAAAKMFGYPQADLLGAPLDRLIPERYRTEHRRHIERFGAGSETMRKMSGERVIVGLRANGEEFPIDSSISHVTVNGTHIYTAILRDITDRKEAEEALRKSHEQLRAVSSALESVRENERRRLAQELHDELGQLLTALRMDLGLHRQRLPADQESLRASVDRMEALTDRLVHSVRRIATDLRPRMLDELGLIPALEWLTGEFSTHGGVHCSFKTDEKHLAMADAVATALYRITQEALTNVAKHARATTVCVELRCAGDRLALLIRDNGVGLPEEGPGKTSSFGLLGIRERAHSIGGALEILSRPSEGTTIQVTLPLLDRQRP
jgi:two-component system sensor kinase